VYLKLKLVEQAASLRRLVMPPGRHVN